MQLIIIITKQIQVINYKIFRDFMQTCQYLHDKL